MKVPDLKQGQMITLAYIIGMLIVLFIVYKILAAVGLIKTAKKKRAEAEKEAAVEMLRTDEYWKPEYWRTHPHKKMSGTIIGQYMQDIYGSIYNRLNTNSEKIFSTFGKLYNKANISELAEVYNIQYGRDLQASLLNNLNKTHIAELMNIINSLPDN